MANKNGLALATIAIAMAALRPMDAEVIKAIAGQYGINESAVISIADEVMAAKNVAESDMGLTLKTSKELD